MSATCEFLYNIPESRLTGELECDGKKEVFNAYAGSGGRAGSKTAGALDPRLANNPFAVHVKGVSSGGEITKIGGPIPMGVYELHPHETKENWIRILPLEGTAVYGRDGFAIHGRGHNGSIGCIVPSDFHNVVRLYTLLKKRHEQGLDAPRLKVIAVGTDMDRFIFSRNA
ncbi:MULTISPECIES: hypothetical protein [unclassified Massilia]|uniref:hypothetical protein n=1 Tax=unclassified Massilia TaxID=2609279 RepID=UPI00177DBAFF|nr:MULTISPECIES: hypothetical protein [unclassified Massilia]MBD8533127.1 hypothetical protein [Massilia sp. CFBP 13647]MBD8676583.1 hypothetical protein [Massilia sp. CFBP 13721]